MVFDIVTILVVGLMIGTELAVSAFINPILGRLDPEAETAATRLFARRLGKAMPFWYILSLLLIVAEASVRRHEPGDIWLVSAAALFVLTIVFTLIFLVPINNRLAGTQDQIFPDVLKRQHKMWDTLHRGRVLILALAMVFVLVGVGV